MQASENKILQDKILLDVACFKWTHIGHLTLPLIGQTLQRSYACSNRVSLLDVQTLFSSYIIYSMPTYAVVFCQRCNKR